MAFEVKIDEWSLNNDGTYSIAVPSDKRPLVQVYQYELPGKISSILVTPVKITYAILIKAVTIHVSLPFDGYIVIA